MISKKLLTTLLLCSAGCLAVAGEEYDFGEGLNKRGYYDLASEHFIAMAKNSKLSADERAKGRLGLGSIYESMSKTTKDKAKKQDLLKKAREAYEAFVAKADKEDPQYAEIQYKLSRLQKDQAQAMMDEATELAKDEANAEKVVTLRKAAEEIYLQIVNNLPKSIEKIDDQVAVFEEKERLDKREQKAAQALQIKKFFSKLDLLWGYYYLSDLVTAEVKIGKDSFSKEKLAEELASKAEEFQFEYDGSPVATWGYFFGALSHLDLGKKEKALELFEELANYDITAYSESVIFQGYYFFAQKQKELEDLEGAIKTCQRFIDEFESWPTKSSGVGIAYFYTKVLVETGTSENIQKALGILQIIAKGKIGAASARKDIQEILKANEGLGKSVGLLLSEGSGYRLKKDYLEAVASFEEAFSVASPKERREYSKELLDNLGFCYYQLERKREAAIIFEHLFDTYPKDDKALKWIGYAKAFYGQVFSATKSDSDKAQYARTVEKEMEAKPLDQLKGDPNFKLAKLAESNKDYEIAAKKYTLVASDSDNYLEAQFKVVELPWKVVQAERRAKKKKFDWKQYKAQADTAVEGFTKYIALADTKLADKSQKIKGLKSFRAQSFLNRADVYQTAQKTDLAVADYNAYLENVDHYKFGQVKALSALTMIYYRAKDTDKLNAGLKKLKAVKPDHKQIPVFQAVVAEAYRKAYLKAKKAGDTEAATAAAKNAADNYWSLLEMGKPLHAKPATHLALLEVLGDMYLNQIKDSAMAIQSYQKVLETLGPFGVLDEERVMYPITDRRLNAGAETKNYTKFTDYVIDKSDFSGPSNKWTEEPINYGLALRIAYTKKKGSYVPGGKFKTKNDKNKKMFDVLAEIGPEIIKRKHTITIKEKLAAAYTAAEDWDNALKYLVDLDTYYKTDPGTKKALADLYKENQEWEKAIGLYHTLRGSYDPNTVKWFDATIDLAICMDATGDAKRIKEAHTILQFVIINAGDSTPDTIKKLAAELAAKVKE